MQSDNAQPHKPWNTKLSAIQKCQCLCQLTWPIKTLTDLTFVIYVLQKRKQYQRPYLLWWTCNVFGRQARRICCRHLLLVLADTHDFLVLTCRRLDRKQPHFVKQAKRKKNGRRRYRDDRQLAHHRQTRRPGYTSADKPPMGILRTITSEKQRFRGTERAQRNALNPAREQRRLRHVAPFIRGDACGLWLVTRTARFDVPNLAISGVVYIWPGLAAIVAISRRRTVSDKGDAW